MTKEYYQAISPAVADALYEKILQKLVADKIYCLPAYNAAQLARELQTNRRYISAVMRTHFGTNFSDLMNQHRVRKAKLMLHDRQYAICSAEEIGRHVGFSTRQSFYKAFQRHVGMTPKEYRERQENK